MNEWIVFKNSIIDVKITKKRDENASSDDGSVLKFQINYSYSRNIPYITITNFIFCLVLLSMNHDFHLILDKAFFVFSFFSPNNLLKKFQEM